MFQPHAYLGVSTSNFVSNKSNKENVLLHFFFFLQLALHVFVCFYESEPSVCACAFVLQVCGRSGTFREVCQQQRFF